MDVNSIDDAMLNNNADETVEDLIAKLNAKGTKIKILKDDEPSPALKKDEKKRKKEKK